MIHVEWCVRTPRRHETTMRVRDVMTTYPSVVLPDDTTAEAARIMRDRNLHLLPVVRDLACRTLIGVLTDRDVVVRCVAGGCHGTCLVREHMTIAPLTWVDADSDVTEVAAKMKQYSLRRLPVLDSGHRLVGVVALADLDIKARGSHPLLVDDVERHIYPTAGALTH